MTRTFPPAVLSQHIAVLGKTGSGKTSTAKLLIEQAVSDGARVCVLDPIKSDWWGLTSNATGTKAGLPFHILGGPRGHVPLHSSAGAAVAEIVANGSLPLSIIDMADFEPGGHARFFTQFAPVLLRKMRGVVYLVLEEAHLFAPKERSNIGDENLSIHWAKMIATAGRSKGVRLVLLTQRTQALHNSLLGSCDTLITHRLTAPADQKPVVDWLKANVEAEIMKRVSASLAGLKTGHGWLCSGEARIFEERAFPRISTYDNTSTPTSDSHVQEVKTAAVDQDHLRRIIGTAVEEAKQNDPKELRRQIAELHRQIQDQHRALEQAQMAAGNGKTIEVSILTEADRGRLAALRQALQDIDDHVSASEERLLGKIASLVDSAVTITRVTADKAKDDIAALLDRKGVRAIFENLEKVTKTTQQREPATPTGTGRVTQDVPARQPGRSSDGARPAGEPMTPAQRGPLVVLANNPNGCGIGKLALLSGKKISGGFKNILADLRTSGWMEGANTGVMTITTVGRSALGSFDPLPTGDELGRYWLGNQNITPAARDILNQLLRHRPGYAIDALAERVNKKVSGGFKNLLAELRTAGLIVGKNTETMRASEELFS